MRLIAGAVVVGALHLSAGESATVITIAQSDAWQSPLDAPSAAISADGRFVAFASYTPLAPADTDDHRDIYVFDRADGRVTLESVAPAGRESAMDSAHPGISGDGRYLVFEMDGEIAWRDRHEATTTLLGEGHDPAISGDGRIVAFASPATDVVPGTDANGTGDDVYLVEAGTGLARRISVDSQGVQPSVGSSVGASVSADGRYVAFASTAPLDGAPAGVSNTAGQRMVWVVYVHDTQLRTTTPVGVGRSGRLPETASWGPALSADGRHVAFVSAATDLVSGDRNRSSDVFLADLQLGSIELVSRSASRASGNGASRAPALSADGRFVAFQSLASDLICSQCSRALEDINLLWDVFVLDRQTGTLTRVSTDAAGGWMEPSGGPALDASGGLVAYSSRHPIDATDTQNDFDLFVAQRTVGAEP